jgi:hypothetical protein
MNFTCQNSVLTTHKVWRWKFCLLLTFETCYSVKLYLRLANYRHRNLPARIWFAGGLYQFNIWWWIILNFCSLNQSSHITLLKGEQIDRDFLIDRHYYAIASKATLLKPNELPVPADKFQSTFGISWETALNRGLVFNALDACTYLGILCHGTDVHPLHETIS